jgi:hypothetical protein
MTYANDNDVLARLVSAGMTDDVVALAAILGRRFAGELLGCECPAADDAIEEAEEAIRAIDARLGANVGSDAAYALQAGMLACMARAERFRIETDGYDAQLCGNAAD